MNRASPASTILLTLFTAFAYVSTLGETDISTIFRNAAIIQLIGLSLSFLVEASRGYRNLVRADTFMLAVLYLLTYSEFLIPQNLYNSNFSDVAARGAVLSVSAAFFGIGIGRHALKKRARNYNSLNLRPDFIFRLMLGCFFLGFLHVFLATNFNPLTIFSELLEPRFRRSWSRGRYGSLSTLVNEFQLLIYVVPPACGFIIARKRELPAKTLLWTFLVLAFVLFFGFASGTRSVFLTYLVSFVAAYLLSSERLSLKKIAVTSAATFTVTLASIIVMTETRRFGLSNYSQALERADRYFVDQNLVNIARLYEVFPTRYEYLGAEVPFIMITRPIPRAFWPGKPEGLSIGIESALGVGDHMTLAASFVGEMHMAGGISAIILCAVGYGVFASYLNSFIGKRVGGLNVVIFATGLFASGIGMRSFMSLAPALLPLIAIGLANRSGLLNYIAGARGRQTRNIRHDNL